jgi:hypothetical protein
MFDRFTLDPSQSAALAADFLDEAHCPDAHGLSDEDKLRLQSIRARGAPEPVSAPTPPKP